MIDVDLPKAKNQHTDGRRELAALIEELGPLPAAPTADTGSGGSHSAFRAPPGAALVGKLGKAIDLIRNGYIVAPPSVHESSGAYRWRAGCEPGEVELAELPAAWIEHARVPVPKALPVRRGPAIGDDFYAALESLDQRYVLEQISGSWLVGVERFAFKATRARKFNLYVDRGEGFEGTSNFVDANGRIAARSSGGASDDGGPLASQWCRWYKHSDREIMQKTAQTTIRMTAAEREAWEAAATADGRTLSAWIVRRCNGEPTTAPVLAASQGVRKTRSRRKGR